MDLSGVIFVALAIAWAGYLIPKALKQHDETARTRPIDTFSDSMRVLRPGAAPVATAAAPSAATSASAPPVSRELVATERKAARMAARRRRRILVVLLACDVVTAAVVALGRAPRWAVGVPVALTLLFLVLCRTQVRREVAVPLAPAQVADASADDSAPEVVVDAHRVADFDDEHEDTVGVSVAELREALVPTADGGTLWDPLPVTLPTYVGKPAARRTVRTIDLGAPGTWTSGRTDADAAIAAYAAEQAAGEPASDDPAARAVNG